jgi:hypothetical protein
MYTRLSSEPLTIHLPDVTLNVLNTQNDSVFKPSYVLRHFPCDTRGDRVNVKQRSPHPHNPDLLVVPQPQLVVQRANKQKLAVWREFDKRTAQQTKTTTGRQRQGKLHGGRTHALGLLSGISVRRHWPEAVSQIRLQAGESTRH